MCHCSPTRRFSFVHSLIISENITWQWGCLNGWLRPKHGKCLILNMIRPVWREKQKIERIDIVILVVGHPTQMCDGIASCVILLWSTFVGHEGLYERWHRHYFQGRAKKAKWGEWEGSMRTREYGSRSIFSSGTKYSLTCSYMKVFFET